MIPPTGDPRASRSPIVPAPVVLQAARAFLPFGRLPSWGLLVWFLAIWVLLASIPPHAPAQSTNGGGHSDRQAEISEKKATMTQLGREQAEVRQRLDTFSASEQEIRSEISQLADLVRESRSRTRELENTISGQQGVMRRQEDELKQTETAIKAGRRRIGQRLRRLYRLSKLGSTAMLFRSNDLQSLTKDSVYLTLLQEGDRRAIRQYEVLGRELTGRQKQVAQTLERLKALRDELNMENGTLVQREGYLSESLRNVGKNRKLYRKYLDDLERTRLEMAEAITRMEKEAARNQAQPITVNPASLRGTLNPPVRGRVIARFGENDPRYDMKKFQRGIVLEVPERATVKAVAPGRIVHAGSFRGYQSLVVLDHGQGLFSVYGHLERLKINRGDWVGADQPLGRATYQPIGETHNVYFEIRHNGEPEDPLRWLRGDAFNGK